MLIELLAAACGAGATSTPLPPPAYVDPYGGRGPPNSNSAGPHRHDPRWGSYRRSHGYLSAVSHVDSHCRSDPAPTPTPTH